MITYNSRIMLGRLTDGCQKDHGVRVHATEAGKISAYCGGKALCGAEPGRRSAGWSEVEDLPINCPKCLVKLAKADK